MTWKSLLQVAAAWAIIAAWILATKWVIRIKPEEVIKMLCNRDTGKPRVAIVDIDGTIADITHRLHLVKNLATNERLEKPNWEAFNHPALVAHDRPIPETIALVNTLGYAGWRLLFVSGRNETCRDATVEWLERNLDVPSVRARLYMRPAGDHRPDWQIKEEILDHAILPVHGHPEIALDDRTQVVEMWRRRGIRTLQVAEGNY